MGATFKLLEGFEGVLERPLIAKELHVNHLRLLSVYSADLGAVSPCITNPDQLSSPSRQSHHLHPYFQSLLSRFPAPAIAPCRRMC